MNPIPETAFGGTAELLGLIERIYGAVHDPSLWPEILARMAAALGGESIACFTFFPDSQIPGTIAVHEIREDAWQQFIEYYSAINPIMPRCERVLEAGGVAFGQRLLPDSTLERTEFYNDFFAPNDMHYSVGIRLRLGDVAVANFSCQRSKPHGEFHPQAELVYRTVAPHLQNALLLQYHLNNLNSQAQALAAGIDAFAHTIFGVNSDGRVVLYTRTAEALTRAGNILRLSKGRLSSSDPQTDRRLQAAIRRASILSLDPAPYARSAMLLEDENGTRSLQLVVTPVRIPSRPGFPQLAALVFVSDPESAPPQRTATLRALFGLTPTEARVAELLAAGEPIRNIADLMKITIETGRCHTKRILQKTGVQRQTDLIRLILSIPGE